MQDFAICSDSSCDAPKSLIDEANLNIIPFYISFDGETYYRENVDISVKEFYDKMRALKVFPKTSLPSIQDYNDAFRRELVLGRDVLCFCLTSKFSGSYQSALNARDITREEFPERTVLVMDSMSVTGRTSQFIRLAHALRLKGCGAREVYDRISAVRNDGAIFITVDTLEYLQRGGRIGKVSAFAGNLLDVKPIILFKDGELIPHSKCRGRKKAVAEVMRLALAAVGERKEMYTAAVVHSNCPEEAGRAADALRNDCGLDVEESVFELGATIGSHIGETVVGVSYVKKLQYI